jgi:cardiolipin synthase (CMP-forming)
VEVKGAGIKGIEIKASNAIAKNRILTVPNQLTFLRLAFLPFFIIAIKYGHYALALGILVAAGLSDGLDGLLARSLNQRTALGAYLDPIADKLLLSSSYLVLAFKAKIGWWLAILVLGRDVLILIACAVILLVAGYRSFPPSFWGKATTLAEIVLVVLALSQAVWGTDFLWIAREALSYIVAALVMFSGVHYSVIMARRLHAEEGGG